MKSKNAALFTALLSAMLLPPVAPLHAVNRELVESLSHTSNEGDLFFNSGTIFYQSVSYPSLSTSQTFQIDQIFGSTSAISSGDGGVEFGGFNTFNQNFDSSTLSGTISLAPGGTLILGSRTASMAGTTIVTGSSGSLSINAGVITNLTATNLTINGILVPPGGTFNIVDNTSTTIKIGDPTGLVPMSKIPPARRDFSTNDTLTSFFFPAVATGGVTGRLFYLVFRNTNFYPTARFTLEEGDNGPEITFQETRFEDYFKATRPATGIKLTSNQVSVARALDRSSADTRQEDLVVALLNQFDDFLPSEFDQIAPEELSAAFESAFASADIHLQNVEDRLESARAGVRGFSSTLSLADRDGRRELDPKDGKQAQVEDIFASLPENQWGVWTSGSGEYLNIGDDPNATGYDLKTGGVTLGLDYRFSGNLIVGVAGSYAHTETGWAADGDLTVEGGRLALYGTWFAGGAYVNGIIGGGYNQFDTHRAALGGFANGKTPGRELDALLSGGYDVNFGRLTFGPTASASYTLAELEDFTEAGSLAPLQIAAQSEDQLRSRVGAHAAIEFKMGEVKLRPEVRAEWQHDYLAVSRSVSADFANGAGELFTVHGPELGRDAAILSLGLTVEWSPTWLTSVSYEAELGRENYERQTLSLGVQMRF